MAKFFAEITNDTSVLELAMQTKRNEPDKPIAAQEKGEMA